ncbi:MAG: HIT family protein [Gammaproteobacteria bacterium]|nr:HIT family protein [Gammaproteobacteria bacterium]
MSAVNATMSKFGYPASLVADYAHWVVLLRPQQVTLGALVLVCKEAVTSFGALSPAAGAELVAVGKDIEQALRAAFNHDKINYLMLMMVDPDVHFHVLPRYADTRTCAGQAFTDVAWPGPPRLNEFNATDAAANDAIRAAVRAHWPTP